MPLSIALDGLSIHTYSYTDWSVLPACIVVAQCGGRLVGGAVADGSWTLLRMITSKLSRGQWWLAQQPPIITIIYISSAQSSHRAISSRRSEHLIYFSNRTTTLYNYVWAASRPVGRKNECAHIFGDRTRNFRVTVRIWTSSLEIIDHNLWLLQLRRATVSC